MENNILLIIAPIAFVLGGFFLGYLSEKIILAKLEAFAAKTAWEGDDVISQSLKRIPYLLFVGIGIYLAIDNLPLHEKIRSYAYKALVVFIIIILTVFIKRVVIGLLKVYTEKLGSFFASASILINLIKILIYLMGFLIALRTLDISITPILTALGVGGLAVALALQDTLMNLFAGIHIVASQQVKTGDFVKVDNNHEGYITDITWRYTTIKTTANNTIIIPNSKLSTAITTNYYQPQKENKIAVTMLVGINADLEAVEKITDEVTKKVLKDMKGAKQEESPLIRFNEVSDTYIKFNIFITVTEINEQYLIRHELIKMLTKTYREKNICMPYQNVVINK